MHWDDEVWENFLKFLVLQCDLLVSIPANFKSSQLLSALGWWSFGENLLKLLVVQCDNLVWRLKHVHNIVLIYSLQLIHQDVVQEEREWKWISQWQIVFQIKLWWVFSGLCFVFWVNCVLSRLCFLFWADRALKGFLSGLCFWFCFERIVCVMSFECIVFCV